MSHPHRPAADLPVQVTPAETEPALSIAHYLAQLSVRVAEQLLVDDPQAADGPVAQVLVEAQQLLDALTAETTWREIERLDQLYRDS